MNALIELKKRDLVKQTVFEEDLQKLLGEKSVTFYMGFDATGESLTVGHLVPVMVARRLQKMGHRPIILVGGGTALIGDPSGRTDMRKMQTIEQIMINAQKIGEQLKNYLSFEGKNAAIMVNNADWLLKLNYVEFIREIGSTLSVNRMIATDCFKKRLETGLSFLEFNYMPMQAYDFWYLFKHYGCQLEVGGDDQWSNILAGEDLIRRKEDKPAFAFTVPLLLNADGVKMGKTAKGALYLSEEKTSAYDIYQYFRNVEDSDVENVFKMLTEVDLETIKELVKYKDERINHAKEILAYKIVALVRGEAEANKAQMQARAAFSDNADNMEVVKIDKNIRNIIDILLTLKLVPSKSEARRLIEGGGVKVDDENINSIDYAIPVNKKEFVIHKGKKAHIKVAF
ncbi:MAG: tyrosine--tRNA ligase [Clostridia bacterium]|nr:tyrosine--tRNA ligase [Clostridia bacterium]